MKINLFDYKITNKIKPIKQPKPRINPGGDCGACCLVGLIDWNKEDIPKLYKSILRDYYGGKKREIGAIDWYDLKEKANNYLHWEKGLISPIMIDRPNIAKLEENEIYFNQHHTLPWLSDELWVQMVKTYLEAGYIGMTTINFDGEYNQEKMKGTNHWVLINGLKQKWIKEGNTKKAKKEVRIGCSVKGNYWVDVRDFLKNYGGYTVAFIRKIPIIKPDIDINTRND